MLKAIYEHRVGDRFGRLEPRANKRRPKAQKYLMQPRKLAQTLTRFGLRNYRVPFVSGTDSRKL